VGRVSERKSFIAVPEGKENPKKIVLGAAPEDPISMVRRGRSDQGEKVLVI